MTRRTIDLYPAIDIRHRQVVRLTQGDYRQQVTYSDDPVAVAVSFADAGATWVHVVDLDAARSGSPDNRAVVAAIVDALRGRALVQAGGGVRTPADGAALAAAGVARVVMGSAAVNAPHLVADTATEVPVAVGLDHRNGELAIHGWEHSSGVHLDDALDWFPSAAAFVITDIGRDGMLSGPDVEGLTKASAQVDTPVIASGGVSSLADIQACASIANVAGVITGKALYESRFTVAEALAVLDRAR